MVLRPSGIRLPRFRQAPCFLLFLIRVPVTAAPFPVGPQIPDGGHRPCRRSSRRTTPPLDLPPPPLPGPRPDPFHSEGTRGQGPGGVRGGGAGVAVGEVAQPGRHVRGGFRRRAERGTLSGGAG